jgi:hypothetical protein
MIEKRYKKTPSGNKILQFFSPCPNCNKERWVQKPLIGTYCTHCNRTIKCNKRDEGLDYKIVLVSGRKIRKYKSFCKTCGKDRGYQTKNLMNTNCTSCGNKKSYQTGRVVSSSKKFIRLHHETPNQGTICARSSYESFYLDYLNSQNINYFYEPKQFIFKDGTTYLPDFYLPKEDYYVELKGIMDETSFLKLQKMTEEYPKIKIKVFKLKDLKNLGYNPHDYENYFSITINGEKWEVKVLNNKAYNKLFGTDSCAITQIQDKKIFFTVDTCLNIDTIMHEITHAYFSYLCLDSTALKLEDLEEVNCEFLAKHCGKIIATSSLVYKHCLEIAQKRYKQKVEMKYFNIDVTYEDFTGINKIAKIFNKMMNFPENQDLIKLFMFLLKNKAVDT